MALFSLAEGAYVYHFTLALVDGIEQKTRKAFRQKSNGQKYNRKSYQDNQMVSLDEAVSRGRLDINIQPLKKALK